MFELTPYRRRRSNMDVYNPFRGLDELERAFWHGSDVCEFKTDIKDNGGEYILEADLPGFDKKDIKLELNGDYLTVSAERNSESEEKDEKSGYIRRERSFGSFSRSFDVSAIETDGIKAAYTNGVLKLTLPKKEQPQQPKGRQLEIE